MSKWIILSFVVSAIGILVIWKIDWIEDRVMGIRCWLRFQIERVTDWWNDKRYL